MFFKKLSAPPKKSLAKKNLVKDILGCRECTRIKDSYGEYGYTRRVCVVVAPDIFRT
jgi:hypothetical protein